MTPDDLPVSEELRLAVKRLRCPHSHPIQPPEGTFAAPGPCVRCGRPYVHGLPVVGGELVEPLAAWLEEFADWYDASHFTGVSGELHECGADDCTCFDRALAVARVINRNAKSLEATR